MIHQAITKNDQLFRNLTTIASILMVATWCLKVGWLSGFGYMFVFSLAKRWAVLAQMEHRDIQDWESLQHAKSSMKRWLLVIHVLQGLALLLATGAFKDS
ncbi:MAG: hypothetical protein PHV34_22310 [Verrucomicrobiae bacterium]|nr:hypothetical protein [Verrucomicrobiae bacterium]